MITSMTGFGQAQATGKAERFIVTLKSVNHRYFETSFHLPVGLDYLEALFRSKIQVKVKRGRVTLSISHINESQEVVVLNQKLAKKHFYALEKIRKQLKVASPIEISALVSLPGVLSSKREELEADEREVLIKSALNVALKKLVDMRLREGEALRRDLENRIRRIVNHMGGVKKRVASVISSKKQMLAPEDLEGFLRSTDVSEEITRIDFHLKSFLKQMKLRDPKGKILDFIAQELQREINTLGAKVQEKHVAYQVVMVKDQIEKIREQVQNVE